MSYIPAAAITFFCTSLLLGCSSPASFPQVDSTTDTPNGVTTGLRGTLHGGQQPIVGASIYLLAAGTTGYGSASTSLLTSVSSYSAYPPQKDANGRYYVTTDALGGFQIADTCTSGQQVYVASVGGNAGSGLNSAATEIAILGQCPSAGNFDSTLSGVFLSEISTVAAAYATAAYAADAFDIGGAGTTTLESTGIADAFANAANLFDVQNINDLAPTNTVGGNGAVPQSKIHTLANILATCINSAGPASPACTDLFSYAKTSGTSGVTPSDVTAAAINIAHNPWANVTELYNLQGASTPFYPQLSSAPTDWSLSISFAAAALAENPSLAIDGGGNLWTVAPNGTAVTELSPLGTLLSGSKGYAIGGNFADAHGLAFDTSNNLWVLGKGTFGTSSAPAATFAELTNGGKYEQVLNDYTASSTYSEPPAATTNLVIDGSGVFYYGDVRTSSSGSASTSCCTVKYVASTGTETDLNYGAATPGTNFIAINQSAQWTTGGGSSLSEVSTAKSTLTGGGLNSSLSVALDNSGNAWVTDSGNNSISEFSQAGAALSPTTGFTGGGLATPKAIALDGVANVWAANYGSTSISEFNSSGTAIGAGFSAASLSNPNAMALDPSGNIWVANATSTGITEFVGLASPVMTPTAMAIGSNALATRP